MLAESTVAVVANTQSYSLPSNFKQMCYCNFSLTTGGKGDPLKAVDLSSVEELSLEKSAGTSEYPKYFLLDNTFGTGQTIKLYPIPSASKTLNVKFWQFLTTPSSTYATLIATSDMISINAADAIVFLVTSDLKLILEDAQSSVIWKQKYEEEIEELKRESAKRINNLDMVYHAI